MIEFTKAFKASDGQMFDNLTSCQSHEISLLIPEGALDGDVFSKAVMENRDKILDILTTTKSSKPSARKVNGGTKKRAAKPTVTPAVEPSATQPSN